MNPPDRAGGAAHPVPFFSATAFAPPVLNLLIWSLLEFWAEPLGFAAPVVVAVVIAFGAVFIVGGIIAAAIGLKAGEQPRALGVSALITNLVAALWMMGFGR